MKKELRMSLILKKLVKLVEKAAKHRMGVEKAAHLQAQVQAAEVLPLSTPRLAAKAIKKDK